MSNTWMKKQAGRPRKRTQGDYRIQRSLTGCDWHEFSIHFGSVDDATASIKKVRAWAKDDKYQWGVVNVKTMTVHLPAVELI